MYALAGRGWFRNSYEVYSPVEDQEVGIQGPVIGARDEAQIRDCQEVSRLRVPHSSPPPSPNLFS